MFKKIIFILMLFLFLKVHLQAEELRLKCTNFKGYSIEYDNGKIGSFEDGFSGPRNRVYFAYASEDRKSCFS